MTGLNEQTAAARGHFQQAHVHPVLSLMDTEIPDSPWLSSGKCYVELEALKSSSFFPKQMHLSK